MLGRELPTLGPAAESHGKLGSRTQTKSVGDSKSFESSQRTFHCGMYVYMYVCMYEWMMEEIEYVCIVIVEVRYILCTYACKYYVLLRTYANLSYLRSRN